MVTVGLKGRAEGIVTKENTALAAGSGSLEVFATPHMVALMEKAACAALDGALEAGQSSVGTRMDVAHSSATPVGMRVWAESELVAAEGKKLCFSVRAYDECGLIGEGTHERFVIGAERFLQKCYAKLEDR